MIPFTEMTLQPMLLVCKVKLSCELSVGGGGSTKDTAHLCPRGQWFSECGPQTRNTTRNLLEM